MASTIYKPLEKREIRLLELLPVEPLSGRLHSYPIDDPPSYESLSYTWKISSHTEIAEPSFSLLIDTIEVQIGQNLYDALCELRTVESRLIWADAICINQTDLAERDSQVQMMQDIFSRSTKVITWLHQHLPSEELERLVNLDDDLGPDPEQWKHTITMLRNGYWSRIWIQQELIVASNWELYCGHGVVIPGKTIQNLQKRLLNLEDMKYKYTIKRKYAAAVRDVGLGASPARTLYIWKDLQTQRGGQFNRAYFRGSLIYCLHHFRACTASVDHDRVFALLGIALDTANHDISINYEQTLQDCFKEVIRFTMERYSSLEVLCQAYDPLPSDHRTIKTVVYTVKEQGPAKGKEPEVTSPIKLQLPSWIPHWELYLDDRIVVNPECRASGDTRADAELTGNKLIATGYRIDQIHFSETFKKPTRNNPECMESVLEVATKANAIRAEKLAEEVEYNGVAIPDQLVTTLTARFLEDRQPITLEEARTLIKEALPLQRMYEVMNPQKPNQRALLEGLSKLKKGFGGNVPKEVSKEVMMRYLLGESAQRQLQSEPTYHALNTAMASKDKEAIKKAAKEYSESATYQSLKSTSNFESLRSMIVSSVQMTGDDPKLREFLGVLQGRQMVVTDSGRVGLAMRCTIEAGDEVWVLYGCPAPVVLRKEGSHYRQISPVYISGYMAGETLGKYKDDRIEIH